MCTRLSLLTSISQLLLDLDNFEFVDGIVDASEATEEEDEVARAMTQVFIAHDFALDLLRFMFRREVGNTDPFLEDTLFRGNTMAMKARRVVMVNGDLMGWFRWRLC